MQVLEPKIIQEFRISFKNIFAASEAHFGYVRIEQSNTTQKLEQRLQYIQQKSEDKAIKQ